MVTWSMTWRDLERSRSWPRYIWYLMFRNLLEIECRFQCNTYRKLCMANRMVTWPMTSRDPERSQLRLAYRWGLRSRKQFKTAGRCQWKTYRKSYSGSRTRYQWCHVTLRSQGRDFERFHHHHHHLYSLNKYGRSYIDAGKMVAPSGESKWKIVLIN